MPPPLFRQLLESTGWGVLILDRQGHLTFLNPAARALLDLDPSAPHAGPCERVLRNHPALVELILDALEADTPPDRVEIELFRPPAGRQAIDASVCHMLDPKGARRGTAIIFKDVIRLERDEERERLKDRLAALGEMAAGLAHEIRNPLGNIGSTAMVLKRKLRGDDSGIVALNNIISEVRRLNTTVTHCLEYAKPVHLKLRRVEIPPLVGDALQDVVAMWPHHQISVVQKHEEFAGDLQADPMQMRQVFRNLIANAFDAMAGKGTLQIRSGLGAIEPYSGATAVKEAPAASRAVVIRFSDTGRGISPEVRDLLFLPFFTTKPGGSGIGLAVAKKIVETHRGILAVESEPGLGATFLVQLPCPSWVRKRESDGALR